MDIGYGNRKMVTLFTAGSLMGAGIALLVAPQTGKKTRQEIRHFSKMAMTKSRKTQLRLWRSMDNLAEDVSKKIDRGRRWTNKTMLDIWKILTMIKHP